MSILVRCAALAAAAGLIGVADRGTVPANSPGAAQSPKTGPRTHRIGR